MMRLTTYPARPQPAGCFPRSNKQSFDRGRLRTEHEHHGHTAFPIGTVRAAHVHPVAEPGAPEGTHRTLLTEHSAGHHSARELFDAQDRR